MDQQLFVKGKLLAPMLLVLEEPEPLDKEGKGTEKERHKRSNGIIFIDFLACYIIIYRYCNIPFF